jgi:hypothetical protein
MSDQSFWEELIAYFPLIRHEPHRKRHLQHFFVTVENILQTCYLASTEGYTDTPAQQFFYWCVYWLPRERIHLQTHSLMEEIYEVRR